MRYLAFVDWAKNLEENMVPDRVSSVEETRDRCFSGVEG